MSQNPFNNQVIEVFPNKLTFHFINIENYDSAFINFIDSNIVSVYNSTYEPDDISLIKMQIKDWLDQKSSDEKKKSGFIAEFICHLYISTLKFEQHFIFENLEEIGSMKKGLDGLYRLDNEMWIYESKSSIYTTENAKHNSNISEAYNDMKAKLAGTKTNKSGDPISPWSNAVHHVKVADIEDNQSLLSELKTLRKRFINKDYEDIGRYNVIPSSTIFLEDKYCDIHNDLEDKLKKMIARYGYNKMHVLCINKKSVNDFIGYINGV